MLFRTYIYIYLYTYIDLVLIKIHEECISPFISRKSPENSRSTKHCMDSDPTGVNKVESDLVEWEDMMWSYRRDATCPGCMRIKFHIILARLTGG